MNRIINFLLNNFLIIAFISIVLLIFVPLPTVLIETLYVINFTFSVYLFLLTHISHSVTYTQFSRNVIVFCLLICASAVATTRTFLSITELEKQISFVKNIGEWLCRETQICGFFATFLLTLYLFGFCKLFLEHISYKAKMQRIDEEQKFQKNLNSKIEKNEITKEVALKLQVEYHNSHYYYGEKEYTGTYLKGTILSFLLLFVVAVGGGVAVGILDLNMYWKDALNQYVMLASGYIVLFTIPLIIATLSFRSSILY